jgi:hypothetical protein
MLVTQNLKHAQRKDKTFVDSVAKLQVQIQEEQANVLKYQAAIKGAEDAIIQNQVMKLCKQDQTDSIMA